MKKNYTAKCSYMHVSESGLGDTYQILESRTDTIQSHSIDDILSRVEADLENTNVAVFARKIVADIKITNDDDPDFILKRQIEKYQQ